MAFGVGVWVPRSWAGTERSSPVSWALEPSGPSPGPAAALASCDLWHVPLHLCACPSLSVHRDQKPSYFALQRFGAITWHGTWQIGGVS